MVTGSSILGWSSAFGPCATGNVFLDALNAPPGTQKARQLQPEAVCPFAGDAPWDAANISGKEPFYDSYDKYIADMRIHGKDYSILPEYRMSDRMDDYIVNGVNPFDDVRMFNLTGALLNVTSSGVDDGDNDFYKIYSHTDFMQHFGVVQTSADTKLNAAPNQISLSCKGLLKLLPYDGFYPASRTVQLASLFSQSYGAQVNLTGSNMKVLEETPRAAYWRAFLTPMFAPGLMFNTVKSGLAVDFPIFTQGSPSSSITGLSLANAGEIEKAHPSIQIASPKFDQRVPFEALVEPEAHIAGINIYDMEVHYSASFSGSGGPAIPNERSVRAKWNGVGDKRYRLAMNNFLAETPEFFLDNETFTTFISAPKAQWGIPQAGLSYKMRVKLRKSYVSYNYSASHHYEGVEAGIDFRNKYGDIYPQTVSGSETIVMYSRPSAFGPEVGGGPSSQNPGGTNLNDKWNRGFYGDSRHGYNPAFTPAYYDGEAWADLEYNPALYPAESELPDLDVLLGRITASYLRFAGPNSASSPPASTAVGHQSHMHWLYGLGGPYKFLNNVNVPLEGPMSGAYECNTNSNQVSSSINLFGSTKGLQDILKYQGVNLGSSEDQWVIQSKFETPILNFIDMSGSIAAGGTNSVASGMTAMSEDFANAPASGGLHTRPIGMWHQYGRLPKEGEGIFLEIADVPEHQKYVYPEATRTPMAGVPAKTGSLADLVGFARQSERLGRTATHKTIREAVVAVPFIEAASAAPNSPRANDRYFFPLQKSQVKFILGTGDGSTEPGEDPMVLPGQSIIDMTAAMQRYVFPPSMDFINYPNNVTPFAMYIFEFSHTLNQQDLVDIWQNLPPRIARAYDPAEPLGDEDIMQTRTVTHSLQAGELLDSVADELQWMVFKVKQKAATNYFRKVVQGNAGLALQPTLGASYRGVTLPTLSIVAQGAAAGALSKTEIFKQTYNWPYDFFSLVELAKIDDEITFAPVIPQPPLATVTGDTTNVIPGSISAVYNHTHTYIIDANGNGTTNLVTVSTPLGIDAHSHQIVNFTLSEHTDAYGYGPHNHDILGSSGGTGGGTVGPPPGGSGGGAGGGTVGAPPNGGGGTGGTSGQMGPPPNGGGGTGGTGGMGGTGGQTGPPPGPGSGGGGYGPGSGGGGYGPT